MKGIFMQHKGINNSSARELNSLRDHIKKMDTAYGQLYRVLKSNAHGLARSLNHSPVLNPLSDATQTSRLATTQRQPQNPSGDYFSNLNTIAYRISRNQLWTEFASGLSRAISRNL